MSHQEYEIDPWHTRGTQVSSNEVASHRRYQQCSETRIKLENSKNIKT